MSEDDSGAKPTQPGWRDGRIGLPSLLGLIAVLIVGGLGGASIGGGFGLTVTLVVLAAMVALLLNWSKGP